MRSAATLEAERSTGWGGPEVLYASSVGWIMMRLFATFSRNSAQLHSTWVRLG